MDDNIYANIFKKSVGKEKRTKKEWEFLIVKTSVYSFAFAFFLYANILFGLKFVDNVRDSSDLKDSKVEYVESIKDNIYMDGEDKLFNNYRNAELIRNNLNNKSNIEESDVLIETYKMYRSMLKVSKVDAEEHMDDIIVNLKLMFSGEEVFELLPDSFEDLIIKYGYVNKNDEVNMRKYKKEMDSLVVRDNNIERLEEEIQEKIRKRDQE